MNNLQKKLANSQTNFFKKKDLKQLSSTLTGFSKLVKETQKQKKEIINKENLNRKLMGVWKYDLENKESFKKNKQKLQESNFIKTDSELLSKFCNFEENFTLLSSNQFSKLEALIKKNKLKSKLMENYYDYHLDLKFEIENFKSHLTKMHKTSKIRQNKLEAELKAFINLK